LNLPPPPPSPHRGLERVLDWVLWFYRAAWPFVVRGGREEEEGGRGRGRAFDPPPVLSFLSSPQLVAVVFKLTSRMESAPSADADAAAAAAALLSPRAVLGGASSAASTPRAGAAKRPPLSAPVTPRFPAKGGGPPAVDDAADGGARSASAASRYASRLPRDDPLARAASGMIRAQH